MFLNFAGVKGYETFEAAKKRGDLIFAKLKPAMEKEDWSYRWAVIALPTGRYAPMIIVNNSIPGGPGLFLGMRNLCLSN